MYPAYLTVVCDNVYNIFGAIYKKLEHYYKALEYADKIKDTDVYKAVIPNVA